MVGGHRLDAGPIRTVVTGGAGFIGSHLSCFLARQGHKVLAIDNLSRVGSSTNLDRLAALSIPFERTDVRDAAAIRRLIVDWQPTVIFHLAAQVAVTTSVVDPVSDFEINAGGTLNVLEAARQLGSAVVFTSTNKVYGGLEDLRIEQVGERYAYAGGHAGVSETQPLDFHSPYGCSKGAADQYVRDYARIYGLATVVFRMSCIYGTHQSGNEDQGWVAHFARAARAGDPLTIFGDGRQVRDVLHIDDLLRAFQLASARLSPGVGQVFNIGGGSDRTLAIWSEFGPMLRRLAGKDLAVSHQDWRPGDQRIYVSDISKAGRELGWVPEISVEDGIGRLWAWTAQAMAPAN